MGDRSPDRPSTGAAAPSSDIKPEDPDGERLVEDRTAEVLADDGFEPDGSLVGDDDEVVLDEDEDEPAVWDGGAVIEVFDADTALDDET